MCRNRERGVTRCQPSNMFFSETSRPSRDRTGNSLTSMFTLDKTTLDKTSKNVLNGIIKKQHTFWVSVNMFNSKDSEALE